MNHWKIRKMASIQYDSATTVHHPFTSQKTPKIVPSYYLHHICFKKKPYRNTQCTPFTLRKCLPPMYSFQRQWKRENCQTVSINRGYEKENERFLNLKYSSALFLITGRTWEKGEFKNSLNKVYTITNEKAPKNRREVDALRLYVKKRNRRKRDKEGFF